jgi:predicted transposase YbfD/YdcC
LKTIAKLKEKKNIEVILQVKGNQPKLLEKCKDIVKTMKPFSKATQKGKQEHGRLEKRTTTIFHKNSHDLGDVWNDHIEAIITVERKIKTFDTKTKRFVASEETAFFISTTRKFGAEEFGNIIRSHWGIENSNHYVKDVSLHEDFSRIRKNPECFATLRSFSLNLMRINHEQNINQALYRNTVNVKRILNYVGVKR